MNTLVTGGAGFIGSHIVDALLERGDFVRVVDNLATGKWENLAHVQGKIEFIQGDIQDAELMQKVMRGIDVVFHEAALPSVPRSVKDPMKSHHANATGTLQVLLAARDSGVKRVVYAGSSSAYGNSNVLPKSESMPAHPLSPYAISKYTGEQYCQVFTRIYGLETVVLRYFNVFGPRQDPRSAYAGVIPLFIRYLREGRAPTIHGDGEQSRDFSYIANVVHANLLASEIPEAAGEMFNIACGDRITINELFFAIRELMGSNVKPLYGPSRPGDVRHSQADITKARHILGYEPKVDWYEGLKATVAWYQAV